MIASPLPPTTAAQPSRSARRRRPNGSVAMSSSTCFHCGEPVCRRARWSRASALCSTPCAASAAALLGEWIASLGLQDYYRLRDAPPPRAVSVGDYSAWDRPQLQRLYAHRRADGDAEVCVLLEGLRCAGSAAG